MQELYWVLLLGCTGGAVVPLCRIDDERHKVLRTRTDRPLWCAGAYELVARTPAGACQRLCGFPAYGLG
ncbi:hypothetical protein [Paenibacillus sp. E194]|uniref:hypothetical protein n=1 Tax=Paenibacillus sp. E194 TaxID=1458845 RepID=UPI0018CF2103|nr:hypothetical protein [Paenibacillus sp. E194]